MSLVNGEPLLAIDPDTGDTYYEGPLEAGQRLVAQDRFIHVVHHTGGRVTVNLTDDEEGTEVAEWGTGADANEAWRYALGAAMGPIDAEYDEEALRTALLRFT